MTGYRYLKIDQNFNEYKDYHKPHRKDKLKPQKQPVETPASRQRVRTANIHHNPVAQAIDQPYVQTEFGNAVPLLRPNMPLPPSFTRQQEILKNVAEEFESEERRRKQEEWIRNRVTEDNTSKLGLKFDPNVALDRAPIQTIVNEFGLTKPQQMTKVASVVTAVRKSQEQQQKKALANNKDLNKSTHQYRRDDNDIFNPENNTIKEKLNLDKQKLIQKAIEKSQDASEEELPEDILRMNQLMKLIDRHKATIASEKIKVADWRLEKVLNKGTSAFASHVKSTNQLSHNDSSVSAYSSSDDINAEDFRCPRQETTLSSLTYQSLKKFATQKSQPTNLHLSFGSSLNLFDEKETSSPSDASNFDNDTEKSPEELLEMYLLGSHTHIEDISSLKAYRHERAIRVPIKPGQLPSTEQIIQDIENCPLRSKTIKRRTNFLSKPIITNLNYDKPLTSRNRADFLADRKKSSFVSRKSILAADGTFIILTEEEEAKILAIEKEAQENFKPESDVYNRRLVALLSYMLRAGLLYIISEYDGKDSSHFIDHLKFIEKLKEKPEPNTEPYTNLMAMLNKTIIYTHAALPFAQNKSEKELIEVLRAEAVRTMWDIQGMPYMSRWCRKGFKEAIQQMLKSAVATDKYLGALIQITCIEVESEALRTLLTFLVDTEPEKPGQVHKYIFDMFFKKDEHQVSILQELKVAMASLNYLVRYRTVELVKAITLTLPESYRLSLAEPTDSSIKKSNLIKSETNLTKPSTSDLSSKLSLNSQKKNLTSCKSQEQIQASKKEEAIMNDISEVIVKKNLRLLIEEILACLWTDWSSEVQKVAYDSLIELGLKSRIDEDVVNHMRDADMQIRLQALDKFQKDPIQTEEAQEVLGQYMYDDAGYVREAACKAATSLKVVDHRALLSAILARCSDPIGDIRFHALKALQNAAPILIGAQVKQVLYFSLHYEKHEYIKIQTIKTIEQLSLLDALLESLNAILPSETLQVKKVIETILNKAGHFTGYTVSNSEKKQTSYSNGSAHGNMIFRPSLFDHRSNEDKQIILRDQLVEENEEKRLIENVLKLSTKKNIISEATHMVYEELNLKK